jgi:hypothetical protein
MNVPGKLVDLLSDPIRNRFYIVRQDQNVCWLTAPATTRSPLTKSPDSTGHNADGSISATLMMRSQSCLRS